MRILIYLLIVSCVVSVNCNAQIVTMIDSTQYNGRVKLVYEFMQRFNGEELHPLLKPTDANVDKANLFQLFDYEKVSSSQSANVNSASQLVDSIISNSVKLHFYDKEWYATARCVGHLKDKMVKFDIRLIVESRGNDMYKWVISDVDGDIFNLKPSRNSESIMLLPNEHESDFMRLSSITSEKDDYITHYTSQSDSINRLNVFDALVYYDILNIDYVNDIEYTFLQVPGYIFNIQEIERKSTNAGWLITSWESISQTEKDNLLEKLHHGHYDKNEPDTNLHDPHIKTSKSTPEEDINKVQSFISHINSFVKNKDTTSLENLRNTVNGRYRFIISDDISNYLATLYALKPSESYFLEPLINCMARDDFPFHSITVSNLATFVNDNILPKYANGFSLISAEMTAHGDNTSISENVIFFIYDNQIAGIKRISDCF